MRFAKALAAGLFFLFASVSTSAQASADERDLSVIATGTTTARVKADINADRINVKSFGADGNAQGGADGTIGVGGLVFSSKSARFTSDDCKTGNGCTAKNADKAFSLTGAGPGGATMSGTITAFIDAHHVRVAFAGGATPTYATPYYGIIPNLAVVTPQTITHSYAPGDIIQPEIAGAVTSARFKIMDTTVVHVAVVSGGRDGTDGTCTLVGTTGTLRSIPTITSYFKIRARIAHGRVLAVDNATLSGSDYTSNPDIAPAAEPVTGIGCGKLTHATVSLIMGVYPSIYSFNYVDSGRYSDLPRTPRTTTAITGSGAGLVVLVGGTTELGGQFEYGVDDSGAFARAVDHANALYANGKSVCIYVPGGDYLIKGMSIPMFSGNGCVVGDAPTASVLHIDPSYPGRDVFSAAGNWLGEAISQPWNGPTITISARIGPTFKSFRIIGDRTAARQQNGIDLYGMNDLANVEDIDVFTLKGHALCLGCYSTKHSKCGVRESHFGNMRFFQDGIAPTPAEDGAVLGIHACSGGSSDDLTFFDTQIYAPYSTGIYLHAATGGSVHGVTFIHPRVEGLQWGAFTGADLFKIGSNAAAEDSAVNSIFVNDALLEDSYAGGAALHTTAHSGPNAPYNIVFSMTDISGGLAYGDGINIEFGRDISIDLSEERVYGNAVDTGPSSQVKYPIQIVSFHDLSGLKWNIGKDAGSAFVPPKPASSSADPQ